MELESTTYLCILQVSPWGKTGKVSPKESLRSAAPLGLPGNSDGKESACSAGDLGSTPGLGRSPEEGVATHASILAWRISMDRVGWCAPVHRVAKSRTRLGSKAQHCTAAPLALNQSRVARRL